MGKGSGGDLIAFLWHFLLSCNLRDCFIEFLFEFYVWKEMKIVTPFPGIKTNYVTVKSLVKKRLKWNELIRETNIAKFYDVNTCRQDN